MITKFKRKCVPIVSGGAQPSRKVLALSMQTPNVPGAGGPTRSYYFLRTLAEETDLTLVCLSAGQHVGEGLSELCEHIIAPELVCVKRTEQSVTTSQIFRWLAIARVLGMPWRNHWYEFLLYFVQYALPQNHNTHHGFGKRLLTGCLKLWYRVAARWSNMPPITAFMYEPAYQAALPQIVRACEARKFDIVWCEHSTMYPYLQRVQEFVKAPITICNSHNVETLLQQRYEEKAEPGWSLEYQRQQTSIYRRIESDCYDTSNLVFTCSEEDSKAGRKLAPAGNFRVVGNGVDTDYFQPSANTSLADPPTVVYTGGFGYIPNQDAVRHFIADILPLIWESRPECEFLFAGFEAEQMWQQLGTKDGRIKYVCSPADIRPCFEEAWVFVVPIRVGGGTRLKVLEAMSMEKAIVSTTVGAEGIPCISGQHLIHADQASDFAKNVVELLQDEQCRRQMGATARQWVREKYDWKILCDAIRTDLQPLLN